MRRSPESEPHRDLPSRRTPRQRRPPSVDDGAGFADLGLRPELLQALTELGYEEATPIQREAIPPLLEGRDLLGQAATGTGKTAAFALPSSSGWRPGQTGGRDPMALVLVPTRELAIQVSEAIHRYGRELGVRVLPIYGGQPIVRQLRMLERGVDVVVATPGRALDHIGRRTLHLEALEIVILDEADEMLDMGFAEDIETILADTPGRPARRCSSPPPCRPASTGWPAATSRTPSASRWDGPPTEPGEAPLVRQTAYVVPRAHKPAALGPGARRGGAGRGHRLLPHPGRGRPRSPSTLNGRGYRAEGLHGGMTQEQRDRVMGRLRSGTADLLVATDVAARGLDIDHLTHVVNYDVPSAPDSYVHRIGRVGRAGREGVAITLAEPREHGMLKTIERVTRQRITVEKLPTIADLRARRLELTRAALEESIREDDLEHFRVVVESLSDEFDVMEVALAAVKLAHEASGAAADEEEIPDVAPRPARDGLGGGGPAAVRRARRGGGRRGRAPAAGMTRLFVGAGRASGIRPQDLVGAFAGETQPERARHRRHRDRRPLLAGGGAGGGGRRGHRRHAGRPPSRASARRCAASATRCR